VPVGTQPVSVAATPDGTSLYVADSGSGTVSVVDTRTHQTVRTIQAGKFPVGVTVAPDGRSVYVANELSANVTVIDARSGAVVGTVSAPSPFGVATGTTGSRAYVTDLGPGTLTVIDTGTRRVSHRVTLGPVGTDPFTVAVTQHGIYVTDQGANMLSVVDARTLHVVATVATGTSPYGVAIT
jgi:YVTN family beta-propeller protein